MSNRFIQPLAAGLLSASLFCIIASAGLGFIFMFLPTLPVLYVGLSKQSPDALLAAAAATVFTTLVAGFAAGLLYVLFLGMPAWYIGKKSLWHKNIDGKTAWFPIGLILVNLTISACATIALVTLFYALQNENIVLLLSAQIHAAFTDMEPEFGDVINLLADRWSFLIFSMTIWLWGLLLYAHAWFANRLLTKTHKNIRPDFAVQPFPMPHWMLSLLAICALASLIGSEQLRFLGNAVMIALMMPYFFLGAAIMHDASKTWPSRRFFLFFVYFMVFVLFWPALILAGIGLINHIKSLNKHLSTGGTSPKN